MYWRTSPGQWAAEEHVWCTRVYTNEWVKLVTHGGKCFLSGLLWDQGLVQKQSSRFPPAPGHHTASLASRQTEVQVGLMDLAQVVTKPAFTCALHQHLLLMTHLGWNPSLARSVSVLFAASGNEAHKSITQGLLY